MLEFLFYFNNENDCIYIFENKYYLKEFICGFDCGCCVLSIFKFLWISFRMLFFLLIVFISILFVGYRYVVL